MSELEDLKERVALLEGLAQDLLASLKSYAQLWKAAGLRQAALLPPNTELLKGPGLNVGVKDEGRELSDQLVAIFKKTTGVEYVFEGAKDALSVQRLLRLRLERRLLLARWEEAVTLKSYPGTRSIAIFATRVNEYGKAARPPIAAPPAGDPYGP